MAAQIAIDPISSRIAQIADAPAAVALINAAYRGASSMVGWTTEARLLEGRRIDEAGLLDLMTAPDSVILLWLKGHDPIGTVHLQKCGNDLAALGIFVVRPDMQGQGLGRRFMREAEAMAQRLWGVTRMALTVIGLRRELIAFYQRRGYALTGERRPFPFEDGLSTALVEGIDLAVMEKPLPPTPRSPSPRA